MKIAILGTRGVPNYYGGFEQFAEYQKNPGSLKFAGEIHEVLERPMRQEIQKILLKITTTVSSWLIGLRGD